MEEALARTVQARFAVAFSNGTAALHAAMAAADLGPGDTVVTSPLSFLASANCARYVGAVPSFVDIDPATLNLDLSKVPRGASAVVAVHYAGLPADLSRLGERPRVVVEDAAHALGASTPDGPVGNCARSDMCTFSFHPVKVVTTGEGGAVTTNDADLAERLRRFRNHGIVQHPERDPWFYDVEGVGFNYRMTDIQAALGGSQLGRLGYFIARRSQLAARYRQALASLPLTLPPEAPADWSHAYHLFPVQVDDRRRVFDGLRSAGIRCQVHYVPIYRHSSFAGLGARPSDFTATEEAYERLLSLPLYPDLAESDQDRVIDALTKLL